MEYNVNGKGLEAMKRSKSIENHKVVISGRRIGSISGVNEINEFDNNAIILDTVMGKMIIKGSELKVKSLDLEKGEAMLEGNIDNLYYSSKQSSESFLSKLFK